MVKKILFGMTILFLLLAAGCGDDANNDDSDDDVQNGDDDANDADDAASDCVEGERRCGPEDVAQACQAGEWISLAVCGHMQFCNFGLGRDTLVDLPADESPHKDLIEWWYWTGNFRDADENLYGFEVTFFYGASGLGLPCWMIHVGIVDDGAGVHTGQVWYDLFRPADENPEELHLVGGSASVDRLQDAVYEIAGDAGGGFSFELTIEDRKGPVFHGGNGAVRMSSRTCDSLYYSRTRMDVSGTLYRYGEPVDVAGEAWMDHQWGNFIPFALVGWDWFSMQFSDGTEIMYYVFRGDEDDPSVIDMALGTYIDENGDQTILSQDEVFVVPLDTWESDVTGGVFPQNWSFRVPGMDLDVELVTNVPDQEMPNFFWNYWEGFVHIDGVKGGEDVEGLGFVELSGYAGRPAFWRFFDVWDEKGAFVP